MCKYEILFCNNPYSMWDFHITWCAYLYITKINKDLSQNDHVNFLTNSQL